MKKGKRDAEEVIEKEVVDNKKQKIVNDDMAQGVEENNFEMDTQKYENDDVTSLANEFPSGAVKNGFVDKEKAEVSVAINSATTQDANRASISNDSEKEDEDVNFKEPDWHLETPMKSVESEKEDGDNNSKETDRQSEIPKKTDTDVEMFDASSLQKTPQTTESFDDTRSRTVLMENLSFSIKEEDVKIFFKNVGEISEVHFDMKEDRFVGLGHVEFTTAEAAQEALKLNDELLLDHPVWLNLAAEKIEHPMTTPHATASKTLYLGNLSFSVEEDDVRDFFKDCGEISELRFALRDERFLGYGHIDFTTAEAAQEALKLNNKVILDRRVKLDLARERGVYAPRGSTEKFYQKGGQAHGKTIFVRGFDPRDGFDNIRSALEKHFGKCGEISRIFIPKDYESGAPKGLAFIDFAESDGFSEALGLDGSEVGGSRITVEEAKKQGSGNRGWSGSGWARECGSASGYHRESGSGRGYHRETGSASGYNRESGSGSGWGGERGSASGHQYHRESGFGGGYHRDSGWGRGSGSGGGWHRDGASASGYHRESGFVGGSGKSWHRESGSGHGLGVESSSGRSWHRESGSGRSWHSESGSGRGSSRGGYSGGWGRGRGSVSGWSSRESGSSRA